MYLSICRRLLFVPIILLLNMPNYSQRNIDIQGHRGARGLYPENTIAGFIHAIKLGVNTLELDVVVSKDLKVIVSHEPYMNHEICKSPESADILKKNETNHNLFELTYEEIKAYDCGSKYYPRFKKQKKISCHKPSLKDMVGEVEKLSSNHSYNIEIKRRPEWDHIYHPEYRKFADLLITELEDLGITERTTVQCFDVATLQYLHSKYPHVKLVYLIANRNSFAENIENLGFTPFIYSPHYKLVDKKLVKECLTANVKLIPWTVNKKKKMRKLIKLGVDGIITDYPNKLIELQL